MSVSFFCMMAGSGLLRLLASWSRRLFCERQRWLFQREVLPGRTAALLAHFPEKAAGFRAEVLPMAVVQTVLDAVAGLSILGALFLFPPQGLGAVDLWWLQRGGSLAVAFALVWEVVRLVRWFRASSVDVGGGGGGATG